MKLFITILLCIFLINVSFAQKADEDFKADALKVIELSGAAAQLKLVKTQFSKMISNDKLTAFNDDFDASLPKVYESLAKTYMKLYTKEDIKAMLAFYESPVGKKMYANTQEMVIRTQATSQEWMLKLQDIVNKYRLP